ncbi:MAG: hypothetical protein KDJ36_06180 [Hyphomicrobiaceae bacterium]|nr:hypothetical protein [Hyphomicrobiaceae bacterium]
MTVKLTRCAGPSAYAKRHRKVGSKPPTDRPLVGPATTAHARSGALSTVSSMRPRSARPTEPDINDVGVPR